MVNHTPLAELMALTSPGSWGREMETAGCKPILQWAKAIAARARGDCTNKAAAPPQCCWCQEFMVQLHLKSLPRPRRGEAAAARLLGWRGGKKTPLLWADRAVGGWVHARVGQCDAPLQRALGKPSPPTASCHQHGQPQGGHGTAPAHTSPGGSCHHWQDAQSSVDWLE